ncbi:MAG TPA: restriction endonuclease subunit S, partial [Gallicola sp.]|nr:restriction endonuclease subunit S [Gallicola sp.]
MKFKMIIANDFCESVRDGTHDSPKRTDKGYKLITSKHIKDNYIDFESAYYISREDFDKVNSRSLVEVNDILYSMIGTIGLIYRVKEEPNFAIKNMGLFKVKDEIKSKWLFYYLKSPKMMNYMRTLLSGSTQQYVTLKNLRNLPIEFPENTDDAKKIIQILETIDQKIELNNQINGNLHELVNSIYIDYVSNINDYNSNRTEIKNIAKCILGGTPSRSKEEYWKGNINWINSGEINKFRIIEPSEYITDLGLSKSSTTLLPKRTTVLAITGATLGQVSRLEVASCANQSVIGIVPNDLKLNN